MERGGRLAAESLANVLAVHVIRHIVAPGRAMRGRDSPCRGERIGNLTDSSIRWIYAFAPGLGAVIVAYGLMLCMHPWFPHVAAVGSFLVSLMSFVTPSFLVTAPECWVPNLGGPEQPSVAGCSRPVGGLPENYSRWMDTFAPEAESIGASAFCKLYSST
jgi:hypothetical protein